MRESIKKLRATRDAYHAALQVRYDELADGATEIGIQEHKLITTRIDLEESAPEIEDPSFMYVSVQAYIYDDMLYQVVYGDGKEFTRHEKLFDLT